MRRLLVLPLAVPLFLLCVALAASAQSKDPGAIQLLQQSIAISAGSTPAPDFTASGAMTYAGNPQAAAVTIKGRGSEQFRLTANDVNSGPSWVVNQGLGEAILPSGATRALSYPNSLNGGLFLSPFRKLGALLGDPAISVSSLGLQSLAGIQLTEIRLTLPVEQPLLTAGIPTTYQISSRKAPLIDVYLNAATHQIAAIFDSTHPETDSSRTLPHGFYFSDYRAVGSYSVPFSIIETIDSQISQTLTLLSIQLPATLSDSDFSF